MLKKTRQIEDTLAVLIAAVALQQVRAVQGVFDILKKT
jgi:hypothetical protein